MKNGEIPIWRKIQRENFTRIDPLLDFLEISPENRSLIAKHSKFPLNLPQRLAEKIHKNRLDDPIFLQFVPLIDEEKKSEGFVLDPVEDRTFCKSKKLLQKYEGRALLLATSACAMHCRFCFRQNFPYETKNSAFDEEIALLKNDPSIKEVILSGGDPLSLSDDSLSSLFRAIDEIPHIQRIRFHSRFPVGIPERIDDSFLSLLSSSKKQIVFILHCNHASELDWEVILHLRKIQALNIPVLNQSVLLKGVNDDESSLLALSEKLINGGIIPYYLHLLDKVQGTAHFLVSDERAIELVHNLRINLSGFGVPRLVREESGKPSKSFIGSLLEV